LLIQHHVVDGGSTHYLAGPAGPGGAHTEQSEDVHRQLIGVEVELGVGLVDADARVLERQPLVADVAQHMAPGVLGHGSAELDAETPVQQGALIGLVSVAGHSPDQSHTRAVIQGGRHPVEEASSGRHVEVRPLERDRESPSLDLPEGTIDLLDLLFPQVVDPRPVGDEVLTPPGAGIGDRL
jgi:hypothetical protein